MSEPDRRHLIQIREGLRSLAFANNGSPLPPAELRRLNRLTAAASITPAFTGNNQITLVATQADAVSAILAIVLRRLNRLTAAASITPAFTGNNQITLVATQADAVSAILAIVYESIRDGTWSRLKACRNSTCRWAFYDSSRNRAGSWCSMSACGNRAKTRAYRLRHRATP